MKSILYKQKWKNEKFFEKTKLIPSEIESEVSL